MVNTEILPRCSRAISASSDTTHLHSWRNDAPWFICSDQLTNMTCSLQVMFAETSRSHDSHHFKRQGGSLHQSHGVSSGRPRDMPPLRPKAGFASPYFLKYVKRQRTSSSAP